MSILQTNSVTNYFDIADLVTNSSNRTSTTDFSAMLSSISEDAQAAKESEQAEQLSLMSLSETVEETGEGEGTEGTDTEVENSTEEEGDVDPDSSNGAEGNSGEEEDNNSSSDSTTSTTVPSGTGSGNSVFGSYRDDGDDPANPDDSPSDSLSFTDMLQLMILQFQSQTLDNTASTTDMMNQLTQMTSVQAITEMNVNIGEMVATNALLYTSSLVGKEVTVGYVADGELYEVVGTVTGSGFYDGQPVIFFGDGSSYYVSDIMAVGRLPDTVTEEEEDGGTTDAVDPEDTTGGVDPEDGDVTVDPEEGTTEVDYDSMTGEEFAEASAQAFG